MLQGCPVLCLLPESSYCKASCLAMKYLLVLCLAVCYCYARPQTDDSASAWDKFKVDFERHFDDPAEEQLRKDLFLKNKQMIEEHNKKYDKGLVSWKMGINQFSDRTDEELKAMTGVRLDRPFKLSKQVEQS